MSSVKTRPHCTEWFEEIYKEYASKPDYKGLIDCPVKKVHNGYFAQDKKGIFKIKCGQAHFNEFEGVEYMGPVSSVSELD